MAEENKDNNKGRLRYFEPATITNNNEASSTAIVFPYEDYNIAVDLQVFINDRYSCGLANETNEGKSYEFSTTQGTLSFLGGTNGYLTTNFTDIQNMNPEQNTQECLGIESINISYDSWLHPTVVIKFVDVRGATVMQPSEQTYYNEGQRGDTYRLYKSLFTFPYPLFILKVKGFYGKGVTYRLAVSKTDIDFDSNTGNFNLTVNFIGHIYGLFADVPMSCLAIAPYTEEGDRYWQEKVALGDFCFYRYDNKGRELKQADMLKFPQLARKIVEVECDQSLANVEAESHQTMQKIDEDVEALTHILTAYNLSFGNKNMNYSSFFEDEKYSYLYIAGNSKLGDNDEDFSKNIQMFCDALNAYDETFSGGGETLKTYFTGVDEWVKKSDNYFEFTKTNDSNNSNDYIFVGENYKTGDDISNKTYKYTHDSTDFNFTEIYTASSRLILNNNISRCLETKKFNGMTIFKIYICNRQGGKKYNDAIKIIQDRIEVLKNKKETVNEKYKEEKESLIEQALGFRPSIRNIFNLAFAHLDTFIHVYYTHLRTIHNQLDKERVKREKKTYGIENGYTDTENAKEGETNQFLRGNYLPPFATFYKDLKEDESGNTTKKTEVWPGEEGYLTKGDPQNNLEEIKFVYDLLSGSKLYFDESKEVNRKIEEYRVSGSTIEGNSPSTDLTNFIPVTIYDIANNDWIVNPYKSIAEKIKNNVPVEEIAGDMYAIFAFRLYYYLTSMQADSVKEAKDFGRVDAINFYKALGVTNSESFIDFIGKFADNANVKSENKDFLNEITDTNKNKLRETWQFSGFNNTNLFATVGNWLNYAYSTVDENKHDFKYYPLYIKSTNELKHDFTELNFRETGRYISSTSHDYYYGSEGDIENGKTLPGGTFLLWETRSYINNLYQNVEQELKRENQEDTDNILDLSNFDVKRASKVYKNISDDVNGDCNLVLNPSSVRVNELVKKDGKSLNEKEISELISSGDWTSNNTLIVNFENKYADNHIHSIFDDDLYRLQTDSEVKAYLFLQKLALKVEDDSALTNKINTVVQKVSLLKEGAYYWWAEEGINKIISAGTINDYVYCIDENGEERTKKKHWAAFRMPKDYQTFAQTKYYVYQPLKIAEKGEYYKIPSDFTQGSANVSKSRKYYLLKYFKKWVKKEFEQNVDALENLKLRSIGENITSGDSGKHIVFGNSLDTALLDVSLGSKEADNSIAAIKLQGFLKRTLLSVCTIFDYYGGFYRKGMSALTNDFNEGFKSFMGQLNRIYGKLAKMDKNDLGKLLDSSLRKAEEDPFKNDDMRLSLYMTLKSLYNKWICGATKGENTWKVSHHKTSFKDFNYEDRNSSKNIYEGDSGLYELDNFIYMDSFYRDIGYNLKVNLTKLSQWIQSQLPSASVSDNEAVMNYNSKSLYQFLTEVAQDCGGVLLAIPQRFMYNRVEDIKDVFTPFPSCQHWDDNTYTYMFLYNYKPAEHLGDNTTSNLDMNGWSPEGDGFNFNDDEIVGALFDNQDNGYGVPAFGVTFGKGNQSYFKDIKLSTGQYGVTEAGLNATFQIAAKGDETVRQTTLYGQDIYKVYANNSYECTVEMMGDMQIFPPMYFQLNNIPLWKGAYIIKKVTHVITPGDAKTTIVGVKQNKHMIPFSDSDIVTFVSDKDSNTSTDTNSENNNEIDYSNVSYSGNGEWSIEGNNMSKTEFEKLKQYQKNGQNCRPYIERLYGKGTSAYNYDTYDVDLVCDYVYNHALPKSQGCCGSFVRTALEYGGAIKDSNPSPPPAAKGYIDFLPKYYDYEEIKTFKALKGLKLPEDYIPQKGDIAIYEDPRDDGGPINGNNGHNYGHICIYSGIKWCSDFRQNGCYVYTAVTTDWNNSPIIHILRHK